MTEPARIKYDPAKPDPGAPDADRGTGRARTDGTPTDGRLGHSASRSLGLTDSGNAERLIQIHGDRLRYVPAWGRWIVCGADGFWSVDHKDVAVRELAKDVGLQLKWEAASHSRKDKARDLFSFAFKSLNARGITGMVSLARGIEGIVLDHEELDRDPYLLGCANGVVDLRSGVHRPARPADLLTMRCQVSYEPNAEAPRWQRALEEWFPDAEVRAYVQRLAGSCLVGRQRDHVLVIHYGQGGNGKGTFIRIMQHVLGPYAVEIHLSLLVQTRHREHDTVRADLFRTRLAVAAETDRGMKLAEASVKNLTGGDRIRARRMREDSWSFDPGHSLWLHTNYLPEIGGRDGGIWRRLRVVEWENSFGDGAQDKDLDETLAHEGPGVLRWLVEGCLDWQKNGLEEPEKVVRDTLAYRRREDVFQRFQDDAGLVFRDGLRIQSEAIQSLLSDWAESEGIDPPTRGLAEWLRERGCRPKRLDVPRTDNGKRRQARFWMGVGLKDMDHRAEQTHAL